MLHAQRFGSFEIVRKLSRSMTDVYLARDPEHDRLVVLKLIEESGDDLTKLIIEAERRGAQLQRQLHQIDRRILEIYDFGDRDGCFFVAMEYFEGQTVGELLRGGRLEPRRAASFIAEICSQLRTLHAFTTDMSGRKTAVVHGDIKPTNVQIGPNDSVRLLDFGIAKVISATHNLTHHNLGSPTYCSPERISKSQVDANSDLWAVGVTLYEMVAGTPPYQAQDTRRLENLIQAKRPLRPIPNDCPIALKAIIAKTLAGDLEKRYPTAEALQRDLQAFVEGRPTAAEQEPQTAWDGNKTLEKAPEIKPSSAPTVRRTVTRRVATVLASRSPARKADWTNVAIALLAGVLAGLVIFIPVGYYYRFWLAAQKLSGHRDYVHADTRSIAADWQFFQDLKKRNAFMGVLSPVRWLQPPLEAHFVDAANNILDGYRHSSDGRLGDFDWQRARLCLEYAAQLEPGNVKIRSELALTDGYIQFLQSPKLPKAALAIQHFHEAESYDPKAADPHLGLARVYVYGFHNIGQAVAELHQAESLGYNLGPREHEEQADGYLYRGEWELARAKRTPASAGDDRAKWLQMAKDDINRARSLYEPLVGFSNVSANLDHLQRDGQQIDDLEHATSPLDTFRAQIMRKIFGSRKWQ